MLVQLVFAQPALSWKRPIDHLELFAGEMSVSKGEVEAGAFWPFSHSNKVS